MRPVFAAWAVLATCASAPATGFAAEAAGDQAAIEREFRAEHEVDLRFHNPGLPGVVGRALAPEDRGDAAAQIGGFFSGYPRGFVARYVREVIVLDDLVVDDIRARGHRNERRMLLELKGPGHQLSKRDFDHELFHALDGYLRDAPVAPALVAERDRVVRLRDLWEDYRLTPSSRYTLTWEQPREGPPWFAFVPVFGWIWLASHGGGGKAPSGFASQVGSVSPREDRATIAEALLAGDERFLRRAASDRELREKVAIVRAMYRVASDGVIDDRYWAAIAAGPAEVPSVVELEARLWATPIPTRPAGRTSPAPVQVASRELPRHFVADDGIPVASGSRPPVVAVVEREEQRDPEPRPRPSAVAAVFAVPQHPQATPTATPTPTPVTPAPAPAKTPTPAAQPSPTAPPATERRVAAEPAPASPRTTLAGAYAEGRNAFDAGDHARAGAAWVAMLRAVDPGYATIQIAINCQFENVTKNRAVLGPKTSFFALPITYDGKACHVSFTGLYKSREDGALALRGLPPAIREQKPRVVLIGEALDRAARR